jgi:hypothetical protein
MQQNINPVCGEKNRYINRHQTYQQHRENVKSGETAKLAGIREREGS